MTNRTTKLMNNVFIDLQPIEKGVYMLMVYDNIQYYVIYFNQQFIKKKIHKLQKFNNNNNSYKQYYN